MLLCSSRDPLRNKVMFLLSVDAALRAREIVSGKWSMVCDADGELTDEIRLQDKS